MLPRASLEQLLLTCPGTAGADASSGPAALRVNLLFVKTRSTRFHDSLEAVRADNTLNCSVNTSSRGTGALQLNTHGA